MLASTRAASTMPDADDGAVLFAVDFSGSTWNCDNYWRQVRERYDEYVARFGADRVVPILWDTRLEHASHAELQRVMRERDGRGGTDPAPLAKHVAQRIAAGDKIGKLALITDGEIPHSCVDACDAALAAHAAALPPIEACLFGNHVDLSVVAPFARAARFEIRHNATILARGNAAAGPVETRINEIVAPDDFFAAYQELHAVVVVQNLGRTNTALRDALLDMQKRLMVAIAKENAARAKAEAEVVAAAAVTGDSEEPVAEQQQPRVFPAHPIADALDRGDSAAAVDEARKLVYGLVAPADDDDDDGDADDAKLPPGKRVEKLVAKLIAACTASTFAIDALAGKSSRARRAAVVLGVPGGDGAPAPLAEDEQLTATDAEAFECPIMADVDAPVLMLRAADDGACVLDLAEPQQLDDITNCPLNIVKYPTLARALAARVDGAVGLAAYAAMHASASNEGEVLRSPYSRAMLAGCIPLTAGVKQHELLGAHAVRLAAARGKLLGNPHLWLAALLLCVRAYAHESIREDAGVMRALERHVAHRLRSYETHLALSGLPGYPLVRAPIGVALWYCATGTTQLFAGDARLHAQERLRQMWGVAGELSWLVKDVLGWPVDVDAVAQRAAVMKAFAILLAECKLDQSKMRRSVAQLYQNYAVIPQAKMLVDWAASGGLREATADDAIPEDDDVVVLLDGPGTDAQRAASPYAKLLALLPLNAVVHLAKLADPGKKFGDVFLNPAALAAAKDPVPLVSYGYPLDESEASSSTPTPICPATLRPWTYDRRDGEFWAERAERVNHVPLAKQLSTYNYFIEYVASKDAFPRTAAEFIAYLAAREAARAVSPRATLPKHVVAFARSVVAAYADAFAQRGVPSAAEFKAVTEQSRDKNARLAMEKAYLA